MVTPEIVGTWELQAAEDLVDGRWISKYGKNPKGYFTFGLDGHVSVQFMKNPASEENRSSPLECYLAYFGNYKIEKETLVIQIEGALHLQLIGTRQVRPFKIQGDRLLIGGEDLSYKRIFKKRK